MSTIPPPFPTRDQIRAQSRMIKDQARAQRNQWRAQRCQWKAQHQALRRGSILGPLLLIGLGVIILLVHSGKLPHELLWKWYGQHWPLLLIAAGVVLLLEWSIDLLVHRNDANGAPIPVRRGLGGGAALLLILLAIAGIAASGKPDINWGGLRRAMNLDQDTRGWDPFLGAKHEDTQAATLPVAVGQAVSIDNARGDIAVAGTSDDGQMHIQYHRIVYAGSDSSVQDKLRSLDAQVVSTSGGISLAVPQVEGGSVDMTVTMPPASALTIKAGGGDIAVSAMSAPLLLVSDHGDISVDGIAADVSARMSHGDFAAKTVAGAVTVTGRTDDLSISGVGGAVSLDGDFFGDMQMERIRGNVHFHSTRTDLDLARLDGSLTFDSGDLTASSVLGPLKIKTRSKDISLTQVAGDVRVEDINGDVSVSAAPPLGNVDIDNRHGAVIVTVPAQSSFTVQGSTSDGDVESDFSGLTLHSGNNGTLSGSVGGGGAVHIQIRNDKGDIALRKGDIAPLPPLPPQPKLSLTPPPAAPAKPRTPVRTPATPPKPPKAPPAAPGATQEY